MAGTAITPAIRDLRSAIRDLRSAIRDLHTMLAMARRVSAVLAIFALVVLAIVLMWHVYLHHRAGGGEDDGPGVIASQRIVRMKNRTLLPCSSAGALTVRA